MTSHHQKLVKNRAGKNVWVDVRKTAKPKDVSHKQAISLGQPLISKALGVPAHCITQYNRKLEKAGIKGARYRPDGLEMTSRTARNEVMKYMGSMDMDAGYGDWAGR